METKLRFDDAAGLSTPLLVVFAVDVATAKGAESLPVLLTTSDAISDAAARALSSGEFKAGLCETILLHAPQGVRAERLLIVGLGKDEDLSLDRIRKAAGTAVRCAKPRALRSVAIAFPDDYALSDDHMDALPAALSARALVEGAELGERDWDTYRSERQDLSVHTCIVVANPGEASRTHEIQVGFEQGRIVAAAQNFARELVNEPGNVLTPTVLGQRTKAMCDQAGLQCDVYGPDKIRELKMDAFWSVAKGSSQDPALIVMRYEPETPLAAAPGQTAPVLGLVGKGITFDTGGISIKAAEGMQSMKYDMAGAAAMIGAMHAIARLKPAVRVISVICSAENMPDGAAYKPGDVVTAMSGKTIEIVNTDAEGRLVLADGLHYAKTLGCTHLIDAATLTGACMVALGLLNFGVFSNQEATWLKFMEGLAISGEKGWRLPCTDDYRDHIKSQIADIMNTGKNRYGGAISGAMFLKEFAGETPWLHLDIAGCAWHEDTKPWQPYGPSGVAVRSIIEWVRQYAT
jgi:leucyl aminopeptidase